ncbi:MAG: 3-dehydroquinate synthase [Dehalococcoidia bacterium]|nr:3-dehydroquinate synthase [Dehalococcoidia bacterium]
MGQGNPENIILTGFSYTGKTRVGREVAGRLGWEFVDIDEEIVRQSGRAVSELFSQDGEQVFRELERDALERACGLRNAVISTGGGAIINSGNRELMMRSGVIVCLEAKPSTIYKRLLADAKEDAGKTVRPLLSGPDPLARIEWLKEFRQRYYSLADWTVHTDNLTVEEVAEEVLHGWKFGSRGRGAVPALPDARESDAPYCEHRGAAFVVTTPTESYPAFVGWGELSRLGVRMRNAGLRGRAHIVSDDRVYPLYGEKVSRVLEEAGFESDYAVVPAGEQSKSLAVAGDLYDRLVERRAERGDSIVALGGGVIGDLAGFVAATFLRGLALVQVPTSLLAMVDSAIGGKVGIDHPEGKNLIGAFYQPRLIVVDIECLKTLPRRELTSGWAEVIKHAVIQDESLVALLEGRAGELRDLGDIAAEVIACSGAAKASIVNQDEKESGVRTYLNYGHTIAHGLEAATGYGRFLHGEAVAIGMTGAAMISCRMGLIDDKVVARQSELLRWFELPVECTGVDRERISRALALDKKVRSKKVRWVLISGIGRPLTRDDVPAEIVQDVLRTLVL